MKLVSSKIKKMCASQRRQSRRSSEDEMTQTRHGWERAHSPMEVFVFSKQFYLLKSGTVTREELEEGKMLIEATWQENVFSSASSVSVEKFIIPFNFPPSKPPPPHTHTHIPGSLSISQTLQLKGGPKTWTAVDDNLERWRGTPVKSFRLDGLRRTQV